MTEQRPLMFFLDTTKHSEAVAPSLDSVAVVEKRRLHLNEKYSLDIQPLPEAPTRENLLLLENLVNFLNQVLDNTATLKELLLRRNEAIQVSQASKNQTKVKQNDALQSDGRTTKKKDLRAARAQQQKANRSNKRPEAREFYSISLQLFDAYHGYLNQQQSSSHQFLDSKSFNNVLMIFNEAWATSQDERGKNHSRRNGDQGNKKKVDYFIELPELPLLSSEPNKDDYRGLNATTNSCAVLFAKLYCLVHEFKLARDEKLKAYNAEESGLQRRLGKGGHFTEENREEYKGTLCRFRENATQELQELYEQIVSSQNSLYAQINSNDIETGWAKKADALIEHLNRILAITGETGRLQHDIKSSLTREIKKLDTFAEYQLKQRSSKRKNRDDSSDSDVEVTLGKKLCL